MNNYIPRIRPRTHEDGSARWVCGDRYGTGGCSEVLAEVVAVAPDRVHVGGYSGHAYSWNGQRLRYEPSPKQLEIDEEVRYIRAHVKTMDKSKLDTAAWRVQQKQAAIKMQLHSIRREKLKEKPVEIVCRRCRQAGIIHD